MGRSASLPIVESCRKLTIRAIAGDDKNGLADGIEWDSQMKWPSGFTAHLQCRTVEGRPDLRRLRLRYEVEDYDGENHQVDEEIALQRFPQPFGGYRWYFICPKSRRRCRVIYQPPGATRFRSRWGFRCRLQYRSQRLAPMARHQHGAAQIAKRVLRKGPPEWQEEYSDYEFPPRPPGMRWRTYNRMDERAQAHEEAANAEFDIMAAKWIPRLGAWPL